MTIQFNASSSLGSSRPLVGDVFEKDGRSILVCHLLAGSGGSVEGVTLDEDQIRRGHPEYPNADAFYALQLNLMNVKIFARLLPADGAGFSGVRSA